MEVAGLEPASLEFSDIASTCLAYLLKIRFSLAGKHAGLLLASLKVRFEPEGRTQTMPASRRPHPIAGVRVRTGCSYWATLFPLRQH